MGLNFNEILENAKGFGLDAVEKVKVFLEGLIGVEITPDFLILAGVGLVVLIGFICLIGPAFRKLFPYY